MIGFGRICDVLFSQNKLDFFNNTITKTDEGFLSPGAIIYF